MKALIPILLLCGFSFRDAGFIGSLTRPAAGGGSCATTQDAKTGATANLRTTDGVRWYGQRFVAGASYTSCKVVMRLAKTGTPAGNVNVHIYSHNAAGDGTPNASLGTATIAFSAIGGTEDDETATFTVAGITSGTTYWIVLNDPQGGGFSGNYVMWADQAGSIVANNQVFSADVASPTWSGFNNNTEFKFTVFSD